MVAKPAGAYRALRQKTQNNPMHSSVGVKNTRASVSELFAQDALFQAVAGVEQHPHRDGLVREHLDAS